MMRMLALRSCKRGTVLVLLAALAGAAPDARSEGPTSERAQVDDLVKRYGEALPAEALRTVAATASLDPWLVLERLREVAPGGAARGYVGLLPRPPERIREYLDAAPTLLPSAERDAAVEAALAFLQGPASGESPLRRVAAAAKDVPGPSVRELELELLVGACLLRQGETEAGCVRLLAAADRARALGWSAGALSGCTSALGAAFPSGRLLHAQQAAERLLGLQKGQKDVLGMAKSLQDLAQITHLMGDTGRALQGMERAIAFFTQLGEERRAERARRVRLIWFASTGQFERAYEEHGMLEAGVRSRGDALDLARLSLDWANVLWLLGDASAALAAVDASLAVFEGKGEARDRGLALGTRGNILRLAGRWRESIQAHEQAHRILSDANEFIMAAQAHAGMAEAYLAAAEAPADGGEVAPAPGSPRQPGTRTQWLELARSAATAAVQGFSTARAAGRRLSAEETLGKVLGASGAMDEALRLLDRVRKESVSLGLHRLEIACRLDAARLLDRLQRWADSMEQAREGLLRLPNLEGFQPQQDRERALSLRADLHDLGVSASAALRDEAALLEFLERGRAAALLAALGGRSVALRAAVSSELAKELDQRKRAQQDALGRYLAAREKIGGGGEALYAEYLKRLSEEDEVLQRVAADESRSATSLFPSSPSPLPDVQARLGEIDADHSSASAPAESTLYVAFNLQAEAGYAQVISRREARTVLYRGEQLTRIRHALSALMASLEPREEDAQRGEGPPTPDARALSTLQEDLLRPLALPGGSIRLLIAPDRELAFVPLTLLLPPRVQAVFIPSATTLDRLFKQRHEVGVGVLAFGDPDYGAPVDAAAIALRGSPRRRKLKYSRAEVESVASDPVRDRSFLGPDFTKRGLLAALPDAGGGAGSPTGKRWRSVHLVCHGQFDVERPSLSALALTPGDGEDGLLTATEILRLEVAADLVVLSACQTGRGRFVRGEGVLSLARAFMHAGAPRVLVSLWNVDDEATAFLMGRFYELWRGGRVGLSEALQQAQQATRERVFERRFSEAGKPDRVERKAWWADPGYWAAWVIWGLPD